MKHFSKNLELFLGSVSYTSSNKVEQSNNSFFKIIAWLSFGFAIFLLVMVNPVAIVSALQNLPKIWQEPKQITKHLVTWQQSLLGQAESDLEVKTNNSTKLAAEIVRSFETKNLAQLPFYIEIPKLDLYEKVTSNVNANDETAYSQALEEGVAHSNGSAFPGQGRLVYIFGHSTNNEWNVERYNAVFYQIKQLEAGDEIILHLADEQFTYEVVKQNVYSSEEINVVNQQKDRDLLLLQTCWPPGTSWQRLFITAKPVVR